MLEFTAFRRHKPGLIPSLLFRSYADYFRYDPDCESTWKRAWEAYDRDVFEHPDTVGACGFITALDYQPIGFASWDQRQFPTGVIGHNCVLPEFRGNGYGTRQIEEVLHILRGERFVRVLATTGQHPFFEPARRMYQALGWREVKRQPGDECSGYGTVTYELRL